MERRLKAWRLSSVSVLVLTMGALSLPASAQLDDARERVLETTRKGAASQERINQIDDETEEAARNFRAVQRRVQDLKEYNEQLRRLIESQKAEMVSINEQIERVKTIERDIVPLMNTMLEVFGQFVNADIPFQLADRLERVERLRELRDRSDVATAEKFRLILEAYQIENDYGRTIEYKQGTLSKEGQEERSVEFLNVGRVALFYQTQDRSETGFWDRENEEWIMLDESYAGPVRDAMEMAQELVPPDLLILPISGPLPVSAATTSETQ